MCDHLKETGKCCGECTREQEERILCEVCQEKRPADEIDKDWRSPGWAVCLACQGDGSADNDLANHLIKYAILEDCKYIAEKYLEVCRMFNYNC